MIAGPVKSYTTMNSNNNGGSIEDDVNFYERELERYMQESLDSTERSRRNLEQSEQIGITTAQVFFIIFFVLKRCLSQFFRLYVSDFLGFTNSEREAGTYGKESG